MAGFVYCIKCRNVQILIWSQDSKTTGVMTLFKNYLIRLIKISNGKYKDKKAKNIY